MEANYFNLLVFGYVRMNESTMNLFMIIPFGIPQMIFNLHPKLHIFGLFNKDKFQLWDNPPAENNIQLIQSTDKIHYSRLMGRHSTGMRDQILHESQYYEDGTDTCNAFISYLNCLILTGNGYNTGVHYLSVEIQSHHDCIRRLGIISVKNSQFVKLKENELDDQKDVQKYLFPTDYNLWAYPYDYVCSLKLDCHNNTCQWFLGDSIDNLTTHKQIKTQKIEENKSWYFVIQLCEVRGSDFEIINVDPELLP